MNIFPTRHGDWHLIDGQLIDLSQSAAAAPSLPPEAATGKDATGNDASGTHPPPASLPPFSPPASKRRHKPSSED